MHTLAGRSQVGRAYGGVWRRGIATAIDWLLIGVVVSLSIGYHGQLATPHSTAKLVVDYALALAVVWLYFAAMEACAWQATLGKLVVGSGSRPWMSGGSALGGRPRGCWPSCCRWRC